MTEDERPGSQQEPGAQQHEPADAREEQGPTSSQRPRGQIRYQDPATATPRPPTLGEQLARQRAEAEEHERELAERERAHRRSRTRRRIMIGSGVGVGLVALVAAGYTVASPQQVTASCVSDGDNVINSDQNCDEGYVQSHGGTFVGGVFFLSGHTYRYYYGGSGRPGQVATGGTYVRPPSAHVSTPSGKTIQRGGFGIRGGSGGS